MIPPVKILHPKKDGKLTVTPNYKDRPLSLFSESCISPTHINNNQIGTLYFTIHILSYYSPTTAIAGIFKVLIRDPLFVSVTVPSEKHI